MKFKKILAGVCAGTMIICATLGSTSATDEADDKKSYEQIKENIAQLEKKAYSGNDLGAVYTKEKTTFKVWAPTAENVRLNMYSTGSNEEAGAKQLAQTEMTKTNGVWSVDIKEDLAGVYYTYTITYNNQENEVADIYAKAAGVNGKRSMVVDLSQTNPSGWEDDNYVLVGSPTDAIIWEVQVKDFSNQKESGVLQEYRGKYLAFTQTDTTLNNQGCLPTCVNYLKALGVNYVQINPFYDFGSVDETKSEGQYNWGYDPVNYNVPEGSFSTNAYDGNVRINEAKQMIKALHTAGIGVIMDVVYNHTYTGEDSTFNQTVPYYYYRFDESGNWANGSGCGNDTASERKMFRKYMIDSVKYWAEEYHIDGFRFDLMGLHDVETMNEIRKSLDEIDSRIIMYGEAWQLDTQTDAELATQQNMHLLNERIAAFNDGVRDAVKGNNFEAIETGFIQGRDLTYGIEDGIKAATNDWSGTPTQTVTYTSCHDNRTLYDKLVASVKEDESYRQRDEQLIQMNKLSAAVVFTSQGIPFMLAGEEMARSKDGDHNSYKSSAQLNQIDWTNIETNGDLIAYYKGLIDIRKNFTPFRDTTNKTIDNMRFFTFEQTQQKGMAFVINNELSQESEWNSVLCILNNDPENEITVSFSEKDLSESWVVVANGKQAGVSSLGEMSKERVTVSKSSALILVDKESFNKANIKTDDTFEKLLIETQEQALSIQEGDTSENATTPVVSDIRDTGNPIMPAILASAMALVAIIGGVVVYKKQKKQKETQNN